MDITGLLERDVSYAVISMEGCVLSVSEAARKTLFGNRELVVNSRLEDTSLSLWAPVIKESIRKAREKGQHTEDLWFIDEAGQIRRYIHRYHYNGVENVVTVLWFEMNDRLNRLLKSYDRKKSRFRIWNGAYVTVKELRTIAYYVQGLSYKAIAKQEFISKAAVSARLQTIAQKAGFDSVPALHTALFDELYRDSRLPQLFEIV